MAFVRNMKKVQIDVKTALLNGILDIDSWNMSPRGILGKPSRCHKLNRAIYGLRQAHLAWHMRSCEDLNSFVFNELRSAPFVLRYTGSKYWGDVFLLFLCWWHHYSARHRWGITICCWQFLTIVLNSCFRNSWLVFWSSTEMDISPDWKLSKITFVAITVH